MYREPLCPHEALPRMERVVPASTGVTRSSSLLWAHAPAQHPPVDFGFPLYDRSSQVAASPCCMLAFPDVISAVCLWAPGPVPRRDLPVRALVASRKTSASRQGRHVRPARQSCKAASTGWRFRGCSHSLMFRLPYSLDPPAAPTAVARSPSGRPGRLHHAMDMSSPT